MPAKKKKKQNHSHDQKTVAWLTRLAIACFVFALLLLVWFLFQYLSRHHDTGFLWLPDREKEVEMPVLCEQRRLLDGLCLDDAETSNATPQLIAVMIENHVEAQPLSGLTDAAIIYEAPVEGHIPRFMALYPEGSAVSDVGPIRSARPYYLDWLAEYPGTLYMHVGGSPDALTRIENEGVFDMNEFYYGGTYFWRSENRRAPHNTYTSSRLWDAALDAQADGEGTRFTPWFFNESSQACTENCINRIDIGFGGNHGYQVGWEYSSSSNQFNRFQFNQAHREPNGEQMTADVIIVQYVTTNVLDNVGRLGMEITGRGNAQIFQSGQRIEGYWSKANRTARTEWYDNNDQPIKLNPGKIWIEVVSQHSTVEWE